MISIRGKTYSRDQSSVYVIAEIGQNHQGDLNLAKEMILEAKKCGADCVKFQKSNLQAKFTKSTLNQPYLSENSFGKTYGEHKMKLEFSIEQFRELMSLSEELKIDFAASAMDLISLEELIELRPAFIKIGSGDANNFDLITKAAKSKLPVIISTGMQTFETIQRFHNILKSEKDNFSILHCISSYPTKLEDSNLNQMVDFQETFPETLIGYSGHEIGFETTLISVLLGAKIVERHFTLDNSMKGSDHKCSLNPSKFKEMVDKIRIIEETKTSVNSIKEALDFFESHKMDIGILPILKETPHLIMGPKIKRQMFDCELNCYNKLGKTITYSKFLKKCHKICKEDLTIKVSFPIPGEKPENMQRLVIGRVLIHNVCYDDPVLDSNFEDSGISIECEEKSQLKGNVN